MTRLSREARFTRRFAAALAVAGAAGWLTAVPARADFVPDDRFVSDPNVSIVDPEFDEAENHMVWQDASQQLWLAKVDPIAGLIAPVDGRGKRIDTGLTPPGMSGNGPEFGFSRGQPFIAYTKTIAGVMGLAMAEQDAQRRWSSARLTSPLNRWRPEGTKVPHQGPVAIVYNNKSLGNNVVSWRDLKDATTEKSVFGVLPQGGRWIAGDPSLMVWKPVGGTTQAFRVDATATNPVPQQMTFEAQDVLSAFSWFAPEFNQPLFVAIVGRDGRQIGIFRETAPNTWTNIYPLTLPSAYEFVSSPEAFVHNGTSYIVAIAASSLGAAGFPFQPSGPSEVWIAGIDPDRPFFRRIDDPTTTAVRAEPEMFMTAQGPKAFYNELDAVTGVQRLRLADTGLGPDWGYGGQGYGGAWAAAWRDSRNSSSTPFPVGEGYEDAGAGVALTNTQEMHHTMGPDGRLYLTLVAGTPQRAQLVGYDTATGERTLQLTSEQLSTGLYATSPLLIEEGDLIVIADTRIGRFAADGTPRWMAPVRGLSRAPQRLPGGDVLVMTFNGWAQIFDAETGQLRAEQNLTPGRTYPPSPTCLSTGDTRTCAFIDIAAIDPLAARIYATYARPEGGSVVHAYAYESATRTLSLAWTSEVISGNAGSPVLAADGLRLYVQGEDGSLIALDAATGTTIWRFALGYQTSGTPTVTENGYLVPGARFDTDAGVTAVGVIEDGGSAARWAFQSAAFRALSPAAAGRANRFVQMARRTSDGARVLLVLHPVYGILAETPWTAGPLPSRFTSVTLREDGHVYVGGSGTIAYKTFRPAFEMTVR
jgi:hypothetical protein